MNFGSLIFYSCWEGSPFRILKISDIPHESPMISQGFNPRKNPGCSHWMGGTLCRKKTWFHRKNHGKNPWKTGEDLPKTNPYRPNPDSIPMFHHFSYSCSPWFMESIPEQPSISIRVIRIHGAFVILGHHRQRAAIHRARTGSCLDHASLLASWPPWKDVGEKNMVI